MGQFRKRPVVIEAFQMTEEPAGLEVKTIALASALLLLVGCDDDHSTPTASAPRAVNYMVASNWEVGPVVKTQAGYVNGSQGVSKYPKAYGDGWAIDLPLAPGHVNYVTAPRPSLSGKRRITMRFQIEGDPSTRILGRSCPDKPAGILLYVQRDGDEEMTGQGEKEFYRWWSTFDWLGDLQPGTPYELSAPLDGRWTSVLGKADAAKLRSAIAAPGRIGFTLGCLGADAGHGAFATAPAKLVVTYFSVD